MTHPLLRTPARLSPRPLRGLAAAAAIALSLSACVDDLPVEPQLSAAAASPAAYNGSAAPDLITSDPQTFADAVRRVGNHNEVIVALKDPGSPRIGRKVFEEMPLAAALVVALPETDAKAPRRERPGLARAGAAAHRGVLQSLSALGVRPYRQAEWSPLMNLRIPDDKLVPVLAVLLHHPAVDYVEANQQRPAVFDAGPLGSNPADTKHTFHNILGAWDYTRGAGARVGVLDSGYSGPNGWHEDGQLLSANSQGIHKNGFVDDYDNYNNCDGNGSQPYGNCVAWDDNGHGTAMAGLVGANDNHLGYVGVMPQGLTVSMKVATNCYVASGCSANVTDLIEDDDFSWGVRWASNRPAGEKIHVLSMSFSGDFGSTVYNALYDAYYSYDILLLSSTGNSASQSREPQNYSFVMGVGGLYASGASQGNQEYEDISAYAGGATTSASCSMSSFCTPSGYTVYSPPNGGTSAATAIASGIAGLVRAYNPWLTAAQTWERLRGTADPAVQYKVDAYKAVLNIRPLSVYVDGPTTLNSGDTGTWTAYPSGGTAGYTYAWYVNGYYVGSDQSYSTTVYGDFQLQVNVTDAAGAVNSSFIYVTAYSCQQTTQLECAV